MFDEEYPSGIQPVEKWYIEITVVLPTLMSVWLMMVSLWIDFEYAEVTTIGETAHLSLEISILLLQNEWLLLVGFISCGRNRTNSGACVCTMLANMTTWHICDIALANMQHSVYF